MADLYGKKGLTRYNFKDDVMMMLGWIEELRSPEGDVAGTIYICGNVDLAQVNRVRRAAGMKELE